MRPLAGKISFAFGIGLGAALLIYAIWQINWRATLVAVASAGAGWMLLAALTTATAQLIFAARWFVLLGDSRGLRYRDAFDFLAIGALAGLVLPNRLSDVARAVAAGRFHATSSTLLFGSIAVERILDVLMLVFFGVAVSTLTAVPPLLMGALMTLLAVVVVAITLLWAGQRGPVGWVVRWTGRMRGPGSRIHAIADRFLAGTDVIREPGRMPRAVALTLAGWICAAAFFGLVLRALGPSGPWFAGLFVVVIINLAGILPAPPAGIGVYHYAAMAAVTPWLPDASRAFAFAVICHAVSISVVIAFGALSLTRKGLSLRELVSLGRRRGPISREEP